MARSLYSEAADAAAWQRQQHYNHGLVCLVFSHFPDTHANVPCDVTFTMMEYVSLDGKWITWQSHLMRRPWIPPPTCTPPMTRSSTSTMRTPSTLSIPTTPHTHGSARLNGSKKRPLSPVDRSCAKRSCQEVLVLHPHQSTSDSSPISPPFTRPPSQAPMPAITSPVLLNIGPSSHCSSLSPSTGNISKLKVDSACEIKHAQPDSRSPSGSCTVNYHLLPSPPVFVTSPYDPEFGNKVCWAYRCQQLKHQYRTRNYGQDVARKYRPGNTPEEIRNEYLAEQQRLQQGIDEAIAASDSESEETDDT